MNVSMNIENRQSFLMVDKSKKNFAKTYLPFKEAPDRFKWDVLKVCSKSKGFLSPSAVLKRILEAYVIDKEMMLSGEDSEELFLFLEKIDPMIIKTCAISLYYLCEKSGNALSGHILLVIINLLSNCSLTPPSIEKSRASSIAKQLESMMSSTLLESGKPHIKFIEFLLFDPIEDENSIFLSKINQSLFCKYISSVLIDTPFAKWPNKEKAVIQFFSKLEKPHQIKMSLTLRDMGCDKKTKDIGACFHAIFVSRSYNEALRYLKKIRGLLPEWKDADAMKIFKLPFPSFKCVNNSTSDACSLVQLGFNGMPKVELSGTKLISTYISSDNREWLFAYDTYTHTISWGTFLEGKILDFHLSEDSISIIVRTQKYELVRLNQFNGNFIDRQNLPLPKNWKIESFHINNAGTYFITFYEFDIKNLAIIQRKEHKLKTIHIRRFPHSNTKLLGNFLLYKDNATSRLHIVNARGKSIKLKNFTDVICHRNKLYGIKKRCFQNFITEYEMPKGGQFKLQKRISKFGLSGLSLKIIGVFENGICVCRQDNPIESCLYFVDLPKQRIFPSDYIKPLASQIILDREDKSCYGWDSKKQILKKITPLDCIDLETFEKSSSGRIVHASKQNLYILNNSWF